LVCVSHAARSHLALHSFPTRRSSDLTPASWTSVSSGTVKLPGPFGSWKPFAIPRRTTRGFFSARTTSRTWASRVELPESKERTGARPITFRPEPSATARIPTWRLTPRTAWSVCRTTYSTVPTPAQLLGIPASGTNTMVSASRAPGGASAPAKKGAANARHATNHRFILGLLSSGPSEDPGGCGGEKQGERDE